MTNGSECCAGATIGTTGHGLRRWRAVLLMTMGLLGATVAAQVAAPTAPPTYCYNISQCRPTLDAAEAVMRADPFFQGAGDAVEHFSTTQINPTTLWLNYAILDRPAKSIGTAAYWGDYGLFGNSEGNCTELSEDQTVLPGWCASEDEIAQIAMRRIRIGYLLCAVGPYSIVDEYSEPILIPMVGKSYGRIDYSRRRYQVTITCPDGTISTHSWFVLKQRPLHCRVGFNPIGTGVSDATLAQDYLCEADQNDVVHISAPVQQCAGCAGSPNPIYPATGEKRRAEYDFEFAGRDFVRYYRSLRQFRNNRRFAVAWAHSWSDRILTGAGPSAPYLHIDENGDYEGYAPLGGNRYRGENTADRVLERVNANGIGWRLRMEDGEVREFDLEGYLIAVRHPEAPSQDISLAYTNKSVSTVTDAQGRMLRFEYAANLLRRIELPDGAVVSYDYDAELNLVGVNYPDGATRRYHYNEPGLAGAADQRHHLTGITAENGRRYASFAYDARGRALSSRLHGTPNELATVDYPDEDSAVVHTADNGSDTYTLQPGTYRRILAQSDGAHIARLEYAADGRVSRSIDRRGIVTEYAYQGAYLAATTEAVGAGEQRREETDRDPVTGLVTEQRIRDHAGALVARTTWTYNARQQTTGVSVVDPVTAAVRTTVLRYCEAVDGSCAMPGQLIEIDGPKAGTVDATRLEYRMADAPSCAASPSACPYRKGDLWKSRNALGHTVEILGSDGAGRILSMRDANGVVTDIAYDARGRMVTQTVRGADDSAEYDDQVTRIEYDPAGTVRRLTTPDGVQTMFRYDDAQRLVRVIDGSGNSLNFTLNASGGIVREETQDADGVMLRTLARTYDTLGRLQATTDAYGRSAGFAYDADGLLVQQTDARGRRTQHGYDALGRLRSTLQDVDGIAAQSQVQYDALDRMVRATDPNGLHTDYVYNGFGDLIASTGPDTGTTASTFDAAGNPVTQTDARGITAVYAYDGLERVVSIAYPDSSRNQGFVYDTAPAECPAGERFHVGRLARMTDASGSTAYCYDRFGHLTRKLQSTQGRSYALRYDYTPTAGRGNSTLLRPRPPAGHLMALTYPDGAHVRIDRNGLRQATELTVTLANGQTRTLLRGASYYPYGPAAQWTYGNGRTMRRSLNLDYLPGFVEDAAPGGISEGYSFDAVGNLEFLRKADQRNPARRRYVYDGLDRLIETRDGTNDALLQRYAYDKTGNRTSETDGTTVRQYVYSPGTHRLNDVGGELRQYDAAGNTVRIGGSTQGIVASSAESIARARAKPVAPAAEDASAMPRNGRKPVPVTVRASAPALKNGKPRRGNRKAQLAPAAQPLNLAAVRRDFIYDDTGRLSQVRQDGAVAMNYLYNAHGERVYKSGSGQTIATVFDEAGHWLGDYDGNGQPLQQAIWLDDLPVGLLVGAGANQKLYYIESDAMGSPRVVIDPDRDLAVWTWNLADEAFGDSAPNQDPDGDGNRFVFDLRLPGQRYDAASGFYDNDLRDYDPSTGRYVQSDPLGLGGGMSTYAYANGSPLVYSDPEGLFGRRLGQVVARAALRPLLTRFRGLMGRGAGAMAAATARAQSRYLAYQAVRAAKIAARIARGKSRGAPGCYPLLNATIGKGSGPAPGFVEISKGYGSTGIVSNFRGKGVDFIFDVKSRRFVMGNNVAGHDGIADVMRIPLADRNNGRVVGGRISYKDGELITNEHSGHYGHLWDDSIRAQFQQFMREFGIRSVHTKAWGP